MSNKTYSVTKAIIGLGDENKKLRNILKELVENLELIIELSEGLQTDTKVSKNSVYKTFASISRASIRKIKKVVELK